MNHRLIIHKNYPWMASMWILFLNVRLIWSEGVFAARVSLSDFTQWAICTSPDSCSEGVRHGRIRWSSKLSMIHGGSWEFPILFGNIWNTCFVGSYSLLIEIYILFHDCKWKFWALMFDSHFYWSHPPNSWLQNVTQKEYQLWLFHSAGGNPAVVRC